MPCCWHGARCFICLLLTFLFDDQALSLLLLLLPRLQKTRRLGRRERQMPCRRRHHLRPSTVRCKAVSEALALVPQKHCFMLFVVCRGLLVLASCRGLVSCRASGLSHSSTSCSSTSCGGCSCLVPIPSCLFLYYYPSHQTLHDAITEFQTHAGGALVEAQERGMNAAPAPAPAVTLSDPLAKRKQDILERKQSMLQVADPPLSNTKFQYKVMMIL